MKTILLITYDISPYRGSEASVSWNYVVNMMHTNRLIVLYEHQKDDIERYLKGYAMPNVSFRHIPGQKIPGQGLIWELNSMLYYPQWHKEVYLAAKKIIENERVDVIHYLNPIGFKEPGQVWKLDKPYIWGPIAAVHNRPFPLYKAMPFSKQVISLIRRLVHNALFRYKPSVKKAIARCDAIGAATPRTQEMLRNIHKKEAFYLPENGILAMDIVDNTYHRGDILNLIWVSEISDRKALIILIDALATIKDQPFRLNVIGDGPYAERLKKTAKQKALSDKIVWYGKISRDEVQQIFRQSHLHIISSLSDATTTVLWEAMAKGVPTLSLDHCGMSGVICEKCGIKIPIHSYKQVVNDIASTIVHLIENPEKLVQLSLGTIECADTFMWDKRVDFFNKQYEIVVNNYKNSVKSG